MRRLWSATVVRTGTVYPDPTDGCRMQMATSSSKHCIPSAWCVSRMYTTTWESKNKQKLTLNVSQPCLKVKTTIIFCFCPSLCLCPLGLAWHPWSSGTRTWASLCLYRKTVERAISWSEDDATAPMTTIVATSISFTEKIWRSDQLLPAVYFCRARVWVGDKQSTVSAKVKRCRKHPTLTYPFSPSLSQLLCLWWPYLAASKLFLSGEEATRKNHWWNNMVETG